MSETSLADHPAHFVPLSVIIDKHKGKLARYMATENTEDVVVTMSVEMAVAGKGDHKFFVAVGVTKNFDDSEALSDEAARQCPKGHQCLFAWVPAHLFGQDEFAIYIDELGIGENLQNGMVNEVISAAAIEDAVTDMALSG